MPLTSKPAAFFLFLPWFCIRGGAVPAFLDGQCKHIHPKLYEYRTVYANLHINRCYGVSSPDAVSYTRRELNGDEPSETGKIIF